ncbi:MAG TPA: hypothetical protein VNN18_10270 [Candidatus Xenobia bacterium]|nr:hypothetical protein [Candidatus Xenobia bacterium]
MSKVRILLWNLLMVSVVLLPTFFVALVIEMALRGVPLKPPYFNHAARAVVDYIGLWLEMAPASVIHSVAMMFLPPSVSPGIRRAVAYTASLLVPGIPMLLDSGTAFFLCDALASTVIATLAYACASTAWFMKAQRSTVPAS